MAPLHITPLTHHRPLHVDVEAEAKKHASDLNFSVLFGIQE